MTPEIRRTYLRRLAHYLRHELPEKDPDLCTFHMKCWFSKRIGENYVETSYPYSQPPHVECGTAACAAGHAAVRFPELGLRNHRAYGISYNEAGIEYTGMEAVSNAFDIYMLSAQACFGTHNPDDPKVVADKLDRLADGYGVPLFEKLPRLPGEQDETGQTDIGGQRPDLDKS